MKPTFHITVLTALVSSLACGGLADEGSADAGLEALSDTGFEVCDPSDEAACSEDLICLVDRCVAAYGRRYQLTLFSGQVGEKTSAGNGWDGRNGAPDPGVLVYVDDQLIGSTQSHPNTYEPEFSETFEAMVESAETRVKMRLFDEDGSGGSALSEHIADLTFICSMDWLRRLATQRFTRRASGTFTNTLTFSLVPLER